MIPLWLFFPVVLAVSNSTNPASSITFSKSNLNVYTTDSLGNVSASDSCIKVLTANVTCYPNLGAAVVQNNAWSSSALDLICTKACTDSLNDYISDVDSACPTTLNISGTSTPADSAGKEMLWKQNATCAKEPDSGKYCNLVLQETGNSACSDCSLEYLSTVANSQYGQQVSNQKAVSRRISSCSASGYSVTYTATASTSTASATASASNARCNVTAPHTETYTSKNNQSCVDISLANNVSTPALASLNALGSDCNGLADNTTLCLPSVCELHQVKANETCNSILGNLTRQISTTVFRAWNPNINSACSNLQSMVDQYICVSPPGTLSIPSGFPLTTATTSAPVPTDAVTTSNTKCGLWHKIVGGVDTCASVPKEYGISPSDFYFLNPQLGDNCTSLWVGNSYCVQPVGNIKTYSGYASTSTTRLASTVNLNATATTNHTKTYFFGYTPPAQTTTSAFNSTAWGMTQNYTLCRNALSYYNLTSSDLGEAEYGNDAWYSEYSRVCMLDLSSPLPTVPFNTSIVLDTSTSTVVSRTASAGASSTIASASATSTSASSSPTSTGISISPNGLCGSDYKYTCKGSQFGECCSKYGDCGSTDEYCGSNCDPKYGTCS